METGIFYELEFYLKCFIGSFLRFKIWAFVKSEHASKQVTGESTDGCVICPCCVIESFAFYADPVFCTFQLCLQLFEVLIGFQVGISFGDSEQAAQCTTYFALCLLIGLHFFGSQVIGADLHLSGFATGVYYGLKSFFFV